MFNMNNYLEYVIRKINHQVEEKFILANLASAGFIVAAPLPVSDIDNTIMMSPLIRIKKNRD